MKQLFQLVFVLLLAIASMQSRVMAQRGTSCSNPIILTTTGQVSQSSLDTIFYYKYTATMDGEIKISFCNAPSTVIPFLIPDDINIGKCGIYYNNWGSEQCLTSKYLQTYTLRNTTKGTDYYFSILSKDIKSRAVAIVWTLSEQPTQQLLPKANINYTGNTEVLTNTDVFFNNYSQYNDQINCNWDFGDKATMNNCSPMVSHRYSTPGKYKVLLKVFNGIYSSSDSIYVTAINNPKTVLQATLGKNTFNTTIAAQGNGVTYQYTATKDTKVVISTCDVPSTYNPRITILPLPSSTVLPPTNIRSCSSQNSEIVVTVLAGQTILFTIDGKDYTNNTYVPFVWSLYEEISTIGLTCSNPIIALAGDNKAVFNSNNTNYYKYKTNNNGKITISFCSSSTIDAKILNYTIGDCNKPFSANVSTCANGNNQITIDGIAGQEYTFPITISTPSPNGTIIPFTITDIPYKEGDLCTMPIKATIGINSFINTTQMFSHNYYTYTASKKGRIIISLCNVPDAIWGDMAPQLSHTKCINNIPNSTDYVNFTTAMCNSHMEYTFECTSGETFYFSIAGGASFDWSLSEIATPQGEECANPLIAKLGLNIASWQFKNSSWSTYTAPANGVITVSNCGRTSENTSVLISSGCNLQMLGYNNDSCGTQSQVSIQVTKGVTYYIWWFKESDNNQPTGGTGSSQFTPTAFQWTLEFFENKILPTGTTCTNALLAKTQNKTTLPRGGIVWYTYTASVTGKLALSVPKEMAQSATFDLQIVKNCNVINGIQNGIYMIPEDTSGYMWVTAGDVFQFGFINKGTIDYVFNWTLTETKAIIPSGANCVNAVKAQLGLNIIPKQTNKLWFVYTAPIDGTLILENQLPAKQNPSNGDNFFFIFNQCDGNVLQQTSYNSISIPVKAGGSYYILGSSITIIDSIPWKLSLIPANSTEVIGYSVNSPNSPITMIAPAQIDTRAKTIAITVGSGINLSLPLQTNIQVLPGITISSINGISYSPGMSVTYNNPVEVLVVSPDKSIKTVWTITVTNAKVVHSGAKITSCIIDGNVATIVNDTITAVVSWKYDNNQLMKYKFIVDTMASIEFLNYQQLGFVGETYFYLQSTEPIKIATQAEDGVTRDTFNLVIKKAEAPIGGTCEKAIALGLGKNELTNPNSSQWISFTPTKNISVARLSLLTTGRAYIQTYDGVCSDLTKGSNQELLNDQPFMFNAMSGNTYLINIYSPLSAYTLEIDSIERRKENDIVEFIPNFNTLTQNIDPVNKTITIQIPYSGSSTLTGNVVFSPGAHLLGDNNSSTTISLIDGDNMIDVYAENGNASNWNIFIKRAEAKRDASILSFMLPEQTQSAIIDVTSMKINSKVNSNAIISKLSPYLIVSEGAKAYIDGKDFISGVTTVDFTNPVTIYVVAEDNSTYQKWIVSVTGSITTIPVQSVSFTNTSVIIEQGKSIALTPQVLPLSATDQKLLYSQSNQSTVLFQQGSVGNMVYITAMAVGTTSLYATASNGIQGKIDIVVTPRIIPVTSVQLNSKAVSLSIGDKAQLSATVLPIDANDKSIIWKSRNSSVSFDQTGLIMGSTAGISVIYAVSGSNKTIFDSCVVTVSNKYIPLSSVDITLKELVANFNSQTVVKATFLPTDVTSSDISWWSADPKVATVDQTGLVYTTANEGKVYIYASSKTNGRIKDSLLIINSPILVTSITIDKTALSVETGQSAMISVTSILPKTASNQTVVWSFANSSSSQFVKITQSSANTCYITGLAEGKAIILIKSADGNTSTTCSVTVSPVIAKSIAISPMYKSLLVGDPGFNVAINILPELTSNKSVTYKSSSLGRVTTISTSGTISPLSEGIDTITITSISNPSVFAKCIVSVSKSTIPVKSITYLEKVIEMNTNSSYQLLYDVYPANATYKDVIFSSSDISIASVSASGILTTTKIPGTAKIYIYSAINKLISDTLLVTNKNVPVSSIYLDNKNISLTVGGSSRVNAFITPTNATNPTVTWKLLKTGIASISTAGNNCYITANAIGTVTLIATSGLVVDSAKIEVKPVMIQSIYLNTTQTTMVVDESKSLIASFAPTNVANNTLLWTSSNETVAIVDQTGKVTAKGYGIATISVTPESNPTIFASCQVYVQSTSIDLQSLSIVGNDQTTALDVILLNAYSVRQVFANFYPVSATNKDLVWSSSKASVKVDNMGVITAGNTADTAIITASSVKNPLIKASIKVIIVNVKPEQVSSIYIESQVIINSNESRLLKRDIFPINAYNKNLKWYSSNTNVVIVDANGMIKAFAPGFAIITAKATDDLQTTSNQCFVTVNNIGVTGININIVGTLKIKENSIDNSIIATIVPSNASNQKVNWVSGNTSIAIVSPEGVITALSAGLTQLFVISSDNPNIRDTVTIEVIKTIADKSNLKLLISNADTKLTFISTNNLVGANDGQYPTTAVADFYTTLSKAKIVYNTVTIQSKIDSTYSVLKNAFTILENSINKMVKVESVSIIRDSVVIQITDVSTLLKAYILPLSATLKNTSWMSSRTSVVDISQDGLLKPNGSGVAYVYAKATDNSGKYDSCKIIVVAPVKQIVLPSIVSILLGDSLVIPSTILPMNATNQTLEWKSLDDNIISIDEYGNVIAISVGVARIVASTVDNSVSAICVVNVTDRYEPVSGIEIDTLISIQTGNSIVVNASILPLEANNKNISWSITNTTIASIDEYGVLTAVNEGSTYLYAITEDGNFVDSALVRVYASQKPVVQPMPDKAIPFGSINGISYDLIRYISDDNTSFENLIISVINISEFEYNISDGILMLYPKENFSGDKIIKLEITDRDNQTSTISCKVQVLKTANTAPKIMDIPSQQIKVGDVFMPIFLSQYVEDDYTSPEAIVWSIRSTQNISGYISTEYAEIELLKQDFVGTDTLVFIGQDQGGLKDSVKVAFTVSKAINTAPVISEIPTQVQDDISVFGKINLNDYVFDDYTLPSNIKWTTSGSSNLNVKITNNIADIAIANKNWMGGETITFTATDEEGLSTSIDVSFNQEKMMVNTWPTKPLVHFYAENTIVGSNETVSFHASITGAKTWKWYFEGGKTASLYKPNPEVSYAKPGNYTVRLVANNSYGYDTLEILQYITVVGLTEDTITICKGSSTNLYVSNTSLDAYKWSDGSSKTSLIVSPSKTTTYSVTITNGLFEYYDKAIVIVKQPVSLGSDTAICYGKGFTLNPGTFTSYTWHNGSSASSFVIDSKNPGTYAVTVIDNNGCTTSDEIAITAIKPLPVSGLKKNGAFCKGSNVTLTATGGISYKWADAFNSQTSTNNSLLVASPGVYFVSVTGANGCITIDTTSIAENALPSVTIQKSKSTICKGDSVKLNGIGAGSYSWNNGIIDGQFSRLTTLGNNTFTVTGTDNNGCKNSASTSIIVNDVPQLAINAKRVEVCNGLPLTLTASGAPTITWNNAVTNGQSFIPQQDGLYIATGTNTSACNDTIHVSVIVNALPKVEGHPSFKTVCRFNPLTLQGTGALSYVWSHKVKDNVSFKADSTTVYSVTGTDGKGCEASDTVLVTVLRPYREQIGVVTYDSLYGKKVIISWNRHDNKRTDRYVLYRDNGRNGWDSIAGIPFNAPSRIVDSVANLDVKAYRYKLVTIDQTCHNQDSSIHRTMHVSPILRSDKKIDIQWNTYIGYSSIYYTVMRYNFDGTTTKIADQSGDAEILTVTDLNPTPKARYRVLYGLPETIYPSLLKSDSGPFSQSLSNLAESEFVGVSINELNADVTAYPNPSNGELSILVTSKTAGTFILTLSNTLGEIVAKAQTGLTQEALVPFDVSNLSNGIYILKIEAEETVISKEIIINK